MPEVSGRTTLELQDLIAAERANARIKRTWRRYIPTYVFAAVMVVMLASYRQPGWAVLFVVAAVVGAALTPLELRRRARQAYRKLSSEQREVSLTVATGGLTYSLGRDFTVQYGWSTLESVHVAGLVLVIYPRDSGDDYHVMPMRGFNGETAAATIRDHACEHNVVYTQS